MDKLLIFPSVHLFTQQVARHAPHVGSRFSFLRHNCWHASNLQLMIMLCAGLPDVILYIGEPLSRSIKMAYLNTCAKVSPFYFDDPVLKFSQTEYHTNCIIVLTLA